MKDNVYNPKFVTIYLNLTLSIMFFIWSDSDSAINFLGSNMASMAKVAAVGMTAISIGLGIYLYLQSTGGIANSSNPNQINSSSLEDKIHDLTNQVNRIQNILNDSVDLDESLQQEGSASISDRIDEVLNNTLNEEILKAIEKKYSEGIRNDERAAMLKTSFDELKSKSISEVNSLSARANVNLAIGATITILAGYLLYTYIYPKPPIFDNVNTFLSYYIPRITTIIFIEVFAFFFLRLYRNNLNDVKYYQNELTNIQFKLIALQTAILYRHEDVIKKTVAELLKTERNFLIKKGETTVELESAKNQALSDQSFVDNFGKFIGFSNALKKSANRNSRTMK